jgi:hypothetical protein
MILDCLSPGVPAGPMRVAILSTAGVLRALCGVAGGSSKASLSAHFARSGNLAELNAVSIPPVMPSASHYGTQLAYLTPFLRRVERLISGDYHLTFRHAGKEFPPSHHQRPKLTTGHNRSDP